MRRGAIPRSVIHTIKASKPFLSLGAPLVSSNSILAQGLEAAWLQVSIVQESKSLHCYELSPDTRLTQRIDFSGKWDDDALNPTSLPRGSRLAGHFF
jgi:hypothetical protein